METLLNWLFENVGNEGNQYTILNVQRGGNPQKPTYLAVMARTHEFRVLDLWIDQTGDANASDAEPGWLKERQPLETAVFTDAEQVIDYLAKGQKAGNNGGESAAGIRVSVFEPVGDAGQITFPPKP